MEKTKKYKLMVGARYAAVEELLRTGDYEKICKALKISKSTLYNYKFEYLNEKKVIRKKTKREDKNQKKIQKLQQQVDTLQQLLFEYADYDEFKVFLNLLKKKFSFSERRAFKLIRPLADKYGRKLRDERLMAKMHSPEQ